jgi:autotransporter-associated beta strand protein
LAGAGSITLGGATLTVGGNNTSPTFSGTIADTAGGPGTVVKTGAGILTLTGTMTNTGAYSVTGGILDFSGALVQPGTGTIAAATRATVEYTNGTRVFGGFIAGPGTHVVSGGSLLSGLTTTVSAVVNQTGPATFTNVTNGGALNLTSGATLAGFTNQGSGAISVAAAGSDTLSDFQSYGTLTLAPGASSSAPTILTTAGTTPLYFNGGSRTFLGTAATAINPMTGQPAFLAGIDLHGNNAVVAGGLFVNNGFVDDSSSAGMATVVADFGALVKGAGYFQNPVITQNGGKFQAGNSPGLAAFGNFVFGPGGVGNYVFAIDDATGTAGPIPDALSHVSGWGLVKAIQQAVGSVTSSGNFFWTATPANPLMVALDTLVNPTIVGTDVAGPMADFDPSQAYSWPAVQWTGTYAGPTDSATLTADTAFDTSGFVNQFNGTFGWALSGSSLSLCYTPTPVPEPGALALVGLAAAGMACRRWRGQPTSRPHFGTE